MKANKPLVHFVPEYFLNPVHRITVALIGAGGNGSQMLSALCRIDHALRALGQSGLHVTVYDPDTVEKPNVGRQLFTTGDLGQNKAECLVSRFNRLYGNDWEAVPESFKTNINNNYKNIIITCVDNVKTRKEIAKSFRKLDHPTPDKKVFDNYNEHYSFYWLDLGNAQRTGQAILGSNRIPQPESKEYDTIEYLPVLTEHFDYRRIKDKDSGPSCSMAEALSKQDLFINSVLVQTAASLLWSVLTDAAIDTRGFYINLDTYRTAPIKVTENDLRLIQTKKTKCRQ